MKSSETTEVKSIERNKVKPNQNKANRIQKNPNPNSKILTRNFAVIFADSLIITRF